MIRLLCAFLLLSACAAAATSPETARRPFASDRISVEVTGSGPDLVLVPGLGSSPRIWDETTAALTDYRYHLIHVAGFDGAAPGANASGPVVEPVAEEIARYMKEAGLDKPALVGHSLGGLWGMMVAARHPRLVGKLMVIDMPPFVGPLMGQPAASSESLRPFAEQARSQIAAATSEADRRKIAEMVVGPARSESSRGAVIGHWLASDARVTSQGMYDLFTTDFRPELPNIKAPLTVLWVVQQGSALDEAQTESFYRASYAGVPQAVIKHVPDSHHIIMLDQPAVFQKELKAFLE